MKVLSGSLTGVYKVRPVDAAQDRVGQKFAPTIRDAIASSWNVQQVVRAWGEAAPQSLWSRQQVIDWLRIHMVFNDTALNRVLANVYATAVVFGQDAADFELAQANVKKRVKTLQVSNIGKADNNADNPNVTTNFDWANWTPGNLPAALLVNPPEGLAKRLADRGKTIKGINDTTTNRIGTILSDGLAEGLSPRDVVGSVAGELIDSRINWADTLEGRLLQLADDQRRAEVIARTEMSRSIFDEKLQRYADMGVEQVQWITVNPCPECSAIEDEIVDIGEPFSNGWETIDDSHPNCNCTIKPVSEFTSANTDTADTIELSLKPNVPDPEPVVGVPDSLDVERALARLQILPNPADPTLRKPEKFVESPWTVVPVPTVDPNVWDNAVIALVNMEDLFATDPFLKRKNVAKHIENMGGALLPYRSYAMLFEKDGQLIIIDGHHRLMSLWLLGLDKAPVWLVKETN
jgi:hypothetical protein